MYEVASHSFSMQDAASNGESYCSGSSSYYADPSSTMLSATNSSYADVLLQPSVVWNAPTFTVDNGSSCKQSSCYQHEGSFVGSSECENSPSRYHGEAGGGHHPGRTVHASAAAAAAVAEATAALRLATSTSMFALKSSAQSGTLPATALRGPTAEGIAVAARLAADAAAAAADFSPNTAGPSSAYVQPGVAVGLTTSSCGYGSTIPSPFQLSSASIDDVSTSSLQGGLHGFHPAANGFIPTAAGTSGGAYSAFQKLQSPWPPAKLTMDAYSSLDACKCLA